MKLTRLFLLIAFFFSQVSLAASDDKLSSLKLVNGDEKANDIKSLKTELLIEKSEKLAIKQAQLLLKKYKGSALEPGLLFRLAELYVRRAKAARFFEIHRQSKTIVKLAPKKIKKVSSRKSIKRAIAIYDSIQKKYPNFDKIDLVYFNNAFARQSIGQGKSSQYLYWRLIERFPKSRLVPDAHLAIGEIAFGSRKYKYALTHFDAVKRYPKSRAYGYGLYKSAWSFYNLQKAERGINELIALMKHGKKMAALGLHTRINLYNEALQDIPLFYEDVYPAKGAYDFFAEITDDKKKLSESLSLLTELYDRHSRFKDVNTLLEDRLDRDPEQLVVNEIRDQIVWNFEKMKKRPEAVKQLAAFNATCADISAKDPAKEDCSQKIRATSIKLAKKWLGIWTKYPGHNVFADSSEKAFKVYLSNNPSSKNMNNARYSYAELLFKRKKYKVASEQYLKVSTEATKNSTIKHDALYSSIVSLEKDNGDKWEGKNLTQFHKLSALYISSFPKGKYKVDMEFKKALIAYENSNYDLAAPIFKRLGASKSQAPKVIKSQDLYLDILNEKKAYTELKSYASNLLKSNKLAKRRGKIEKIYQQSYFLEIQNFEKDKNYSKAITEYKKFIRVSKDPELSRKAYLNTIALYTKTGELFNAASSLVNYSVKYPKTKEAKDSLIQAANIYENLAQPKLAADVLVKISAQDPQFKSKWMSLAADYYQIDGKTEKAKAIYKKLYNSPGNKYSAHALKQLVALEKEYGTVASYEFWLKKNLNSPDRAQVAEAKLHFLNATYKRKDYSSAFAQAKSIINLGPSAGAYPRAQARLIQAKILKGELERQSVKTSISRVALVLGLKTEKLEKAQRAFQAVLRYKDPATSSEALKGLGESYLSYSNALMNMPSPRGLTAQELPTFKSEIEKLALPIEEKGIETLLEAYKAAQATDASAQTLAEIKTILKQNNQSVPEVTTFKMSSPRLEVPKFKSLILGGL